MYDLEGLITPAPVHDAKRYDWLVTWRSPGDLTFRVGGFEAGLSRTRRAETSPTPSAD